MAQWREANPNSDWVAEEEAAHTVSRAGRQQRARRPAARARPTARITKRRRRWCGRTRPTSSSSRARWSSTAATSSEQDRGVVRHVPPARRQHAPRDLPEVPAAARPRRAAPRHDQLVHRAPRARQALAAATRGCAPWRRTSPPSAKARRSTTASADGAVIGSAGVVCRSWREPRPSARGDEGGMEMNGRRRSGALEAAPPIGIGRALSRGYRSQGDDLVRAAIVGAMRPACTTGSRFRPTSRPGATVRSPRPPGSRTRGSTTRSSSAPTSTRRWRWRPSTRAPCGSARWSRFPATASRR